MCTGGIDYFFIPNLGVEINFGTSGESDTYYSFGGKYWFADKYSNSAFSPFTGFCRFYTLKQTVMAHYKKNKARLR
jgi:hypothetical protein